MNGCRMQAAMNEYMRPIAAAAAARHRRQGDADAHCLLLLAIIGHHQIMNNYSKQFSWRV